MRRLAAAAASAWACILVFTWHLADRRIEICDLHSECALRATATRDGILTNGLTVLLVISVLAAVMLGGRGTPPGALVKRATPFTPTNNMRTPSSFTSRLPHPWAKVGRAAWRALAVALVLLVTIASVFSFLGPRAPQDPYASISATVERDPLGAPRGPTQK